MLRREAAAGPPTFDRRALLRGAATTAVSSAAIAGTLGMFMARQARAARGGGFLPSAELVPCPYGNVEPRKDEVTGLPLIGLPPGFRYWSHGWTGDRIVPNLPQPVTPGLHDGMGVISQAGPLVVLCRNHEAFVGRSYFNGPQQYSPGAPGGNTNLVFDTRRKKWLAVFPSLSGTFRNCSGGVTPQGTWLSCEETLETTVADPADPGSARFSHGWVFEVPANRPSNGQPLKAMGRRTHEAAAVDPRTGIVYLTEDATPGGVYRFIPEDCHDYGRGGRLEVLKVVGRPNVNLRGPAPQGGGGAPYPVPVGTPMDVEWVPINDPENLNSNSNYAQGAEQGAADFRRPEGATYGDGTLYFVSTDGGQVGQGQVWALDLARQQLTAIYDSPSVDALDNPDNLVVTPRGGLLFCEDNAGTGAFLLDGVNTERMVGLTRDGRIFTFATNLLDFSGATPTSMQPYTRPDNAVVFDQNYRSNEWAGATFDRHGEWLFVNIQTPGITFAITGPWRNGPL